MEKKDFLEKSYKLQWYFIDKKDYYEEVDWIGYLSGYNESLYIIIQGKNVLYNLKDSFDLYYTDRIWQYINNPSYVNSYWLKNLSDLEYSKSSDYNNFKKMKLNFFEYRKLLKTIKMSRKTIK